MKKRILGLLLASCVTLGAMPVNLVLAEETGQTEAAQETEDDAPAVNTESEEVQQGYESPEETYEMEEEAGQKQKEE